MIAKNSLVDFGKRSSLLIASQFLKLLVQLLILYWYARLLSLNEYGRYQLVWLISNLLSVIGLFGLPSVLLSYSLGSIQGFIRSKRHLFLSITLLLQIVPIVYLWITKKNLDNTELLLLMAMILVQHLTIIAETIAMKQQLEKKLFTVNITYQILFLTAHFLIFYSSYTLSYLLLGLIGCLLIKLLLLWKPLMSIFKTQSPHTFDKNIGAQWLYLGLNDLMGLLFKWIDKWFILLLLTVAQFAVYFNGSYEIPIFALMVNAVGNVMLIDMARNKTARSTVNTFHRSALLLSAFVYPAFAYLLFFYTDLFTLLFSNKYEAALPIFFVSLFILPLRITNYTAALQVHQQTDKILKGSILDIVLALLLALFLYPWKGLPGLAAAFVLSTWIQGFYYGWHTAKLLKVPMFSLLPFPSLLQWMLICVASMGIGKYVVPGNYYVIELMIGAIISGVLALLMLLAYRKKTQEETTPTQLEEAGNL